MTEEWKPIPGWEETYSVSNLGRVRRERTNRRGRAGTILDPWLSYAGYPTVRLTDTPRRLNIQVHRLVMAAFVGPCPANQEVNHKDGIKANPRLDNLEYVSRRENIRHAFATGLNSPHPAWNKGKRIDDVDSTKIAVTCARCQTVFLDHPSQNRKFCSRKCTNAKTIATGTCIVCGTQFTGKPSRVAAKQYCSYQCRGTKTITNVKHFKPSKQNANCERCGASFEFTPGVHRGRFCSRDCFRNRAIPPAR